MVGARLKKRPRSQGAAMVELAIVLPVLLLLLLGLMELGWAFYRMSQLTTAARHTARVAARPDATNEEVAARLDQIMADLGMGEVGYTFAITPGVDPSVGEPVHVALQVPYSEITLTGVGFIPMPEQLRGHAAMAKEGP
ncbi:MAG: TadE/TadG family type IV pilus assembly protein [Phycisphaeraceae bacterium]